MKSAWINPMSVTKIAQAMLQLDRTHLQEWYHQNAVGFMDQLRRALEHYQNSAYGGIKRNTIELIEEALIHLLAEVKAFIALLTPEAREELAQQFREKDNFN